MMFEWLPKTTPGYKPAVHVWMDVHDCMPSDFPAKTGVYNKKSSEVTVKHDGELLFVYGHVHDGKDCHDHLFPCSQVFQVNDLMKY
jgi:hypothetical protein